MLNVLKSMKKIGKLILVSFVTTIVCVILSLEQFINESFWDTIGTIAMLFFLVFSAYAIIKFIVLCIILCKNNTIRNRFEDDPSLRNAKKYIFDENFALYLSESGYIGFCQDYKLNYLTHISNITSYGILTEYGEILFDGSINNLMNSLSSMTQNYNVINRLYILFNTNDFNKPRVKVPFITKKTEMSYFNIDNKDDLIDIFRMLDFLDTCFNVNRAKGINFSKS
ncbi:hypothetical protein PV797_03560 [Clostridiaceae bacterium M8S5]|nr:hypothetical protein PV797_03560 [Clostridiaceae bacterium M8S5]